MSLSVVAPSEPARTRLGAVPDRIDALRRFVRAVEGYLPERKLVAARTVLNRAGERLALSGEHCVIALAGTTGSGKSSVFNALAKLELSQVGVVRPTTGVAHACAWGTDGADPLLDWLGVPPSRRFARESALDADDEASLRGLVLLDLPDFDSVEKAHRIEADRLLAMVDLVVWVLDPQKYGDQLVHHQYLTNFRGHLGSTVVVLNQVDRLGPADTQRVVADLGRLLVEDGLEGVSVLTTSAIGRPGLGPVRTLVEATVAGRQASLTRLGGDLDEVVADLAPLVGSEPGEAGVDRDSVKELTDTLAAIAGLPAAVDNAERVQTRTARTELSWPLAELVSRFRDADTAPPAGARVARRATDAQVAAVGLAARTLADRVGAGLPTPWPAAVRIAARSKLPELPDALDAVIGATDTTGRPAPTWWRAIGATLWLGALACAGGLVWLLVALVSGGSPTGAAVLLADGLITGGVGFGLRRWLVTTAGRQTRGQVERRLSTAVAAVAAGRVALPVGDVLEAYAAARQALADAR